MALKNICLVMCERHGTDELQIDNGQFIYYHDLFSIIPNTLCVCVCFVINFRYLIELKWIEMSAAPNAYWANCVVRRILLLLFMLCSMFAILLLYPIIIHFCFRISCEVVHRVEYVCLHAISFEITCDSLMYLYC